MMRRILHSTKKYPSITIHRFGDGIMMNALSVSGIPMSSNHFSLSALLGTTTPTAVLDSINAANNGTTQAFGGANDIYATGYNAFIDTVITPMRASSEMVQASVDKITGRDYYQTITSSKQLSKPICPRTQDVILYMPEIRELLEEGSIDGWGRTPSSLTSEHDPYANIEKSGFVDYTAESLAESDGEITIPYDWYSEDPEVTFEESVAIRETRMFIRQFLADEDTKYYDPTDYPSLRA